MEDALFYPVMIPCGEYWGLLPAYASAIPGFAKNKIWKVCRANLPNKPLMKILVIGSINDLIGSCPSDLRREVPRFAQEADTQVEEEMETAQLTNPDWSEDNRLEKVNVNRALRCWKAAVGDIIIELFSESVPKNQLPLVLTNFSRSLKLLKGTRELPWKGEENKGRADRASAFQTNLKLEFMDIPRLHGVGASGATHAVAVSAAASASMEPTPTSGLSSDGIVTETEL